MKKELLAGTATWCIAFAENDNATSADSHRMCNSCYFRVSSNLFDITVRFT